jgi:competence protein ComEC
MFNVVGKIGQADCHLLQFPDGSNILIDVADGVDVPGAALAHLNKLHIHRLALVVISHFHKDHYGRLIDVLNAGIRVDRVVLNVPNKKSADREIPWGCDWKDVQETLNELRHRGIPFATPKAGDRIFETKSKDGVVAGMDVICCFDGLNTPVGPTDVNDTSIVVRLSYGKERVLFTGDLNSAIGSYLAKSATDLAADLLKAPHHGTDATVPNAFYDRVGATAALVPSPKVFWESARSMRTRDYFIERHIPIYVSGINGDVTVTITKDSYTIHAEH